MATNPFPVEFTGKDQLRALKFPRAAVWALNRVIRSVKAKGSQFARQTYNIGKDDLDSALSIDYASEGNLRARVKGTRRPFGMARFATGQPQRAGTSGFVQPKRGTRVRIKKGAAKIGYDTKTGQIVFWAWAKSGKAAKGRVALFSREGPERDAPIRFAYAMGAVDMFYAARNVARIRQFAEEKLPEELTRQVAAFIRRF